MSRQIQVVYTPNLFPLYADNESIVVVADVFRATSVMCSAFYHGVKSIRPVKHLEEADPYRDQENIILVGERHGAKVEGFDEGNSPLVYHDGKYEGKELVMTTTNGTHAIKLAAEGHQVVIGAFLNLSKVIEYVLSRTENVIILCAGWKEKFNIEDTVFAGALAEELLKNGFESNCDGAKAAMDLYSVAEGRLLEYLSNSNHFRRLQRLGITADMEYCLEIDAAPSLPLLRGELLVDASK
jgi:2-phosphosulfolactate phosphatase